MRVRSSKRSADKQRSRDRILDAAARRLRADGLEGAAIAEVMSEAGLTHGAFYAHFDTKAELANAAFAHAITTGRPRWIARPRGESWRTRLTELAARYLTPEHRDGIADGCGFAALSGEAAHSPEQFRTTFERELRLSLAAICGEDPSDHPERLDDAIALMALCVGGLSLARAVPDRELSNRILQAARQAAANIAAHQHD